MLKWVNILHLHQPPYQDEAVVKRIASESYELIIALLAQYPALTLTINISGSLIECLLRTGLRNIIEHIHAYAGEGRIELMGTALHHPILPLLPVEEAQRQIDLYLALFAETFPGIPQPKGFFFPEMAYAKSIGELVARKGFQWIVLDENHAGTEVDPAVHYRIQGLPLSVLFRNRTISSNFPPEAIFTYLDITHTDGALITAHDGEMYGHRHRDDNGFYEKAFANPLITFACASDYLRSLTTEAVIEPKEISWETTPEDEKAGAPYSLWQHPSNEIQELMWAFAHFCLQAIGNAKNDRHFSEARKRIDRGLTSCSWWWMSGRKVGSFSPVSWHPSETKKGLDELLASIRLLTTLSPKTKKEAEGLYEDIITRIAQSHAYMQKQRDDTATNN